MNLLQGCYYYKVQRSSEPAGPAITKLQDASKFLILHVHDTAWQFADVIASDDTISGKVFPLTGHDKYLTTKEVGVNRYKKRPAKDESAVLNEVHIYVDSVKFISYVNPVNFISNADSVNLISNADSVNFISHADSVDFFSGTAVAFPANSVTKIELYDRAVGATVASWIFGSLGIPALVIGTAAIIVAATKESCPFIYVERNKSAEFIGEIYSGAIYPSVERDDYLLLPAPGYSQKNYTVYMTNEVHEIQNTNLIELDVFDHPEGTDILVDKYGKYHTITDLTSPFKATNLQGQNILYLIREKDSLSYIGNKVEKDPVLTDGIIMSFKRPENSSDAKLVVKARNTFWLDYVFARFHELFGTQYDCWVDKQKTIPSEKMKSWNLDQHIPLSLYIEKNGQWQFLDYYNVIGPMAAKEDILSFDISGINSDSVKIKLEYGLLFWEIDFAAIDFTIDIPVTQRVAQFSRAIDNYEHDVKYLLSSTDMLYYVQPEIGDAVKMDFELPEPSAARQTLFLHSRGYYKILMNLTGKEKVGQLLAFKRKDHFPQFSKELFIKKSGIKVD